MQKFGKAFTEFATATSRAAGRPVTFVICCLAVVGWGLSGPLFGFSDTWQLVINTSTTIITFLMVFLIQNTQNRDSQALHAKLDELIRVSSGHNSFIGIENLSDRELERILAKFDSQSTRLGDEARKELSSREKGGRSAQTPVKQAPSPKPPAARPRAKKRAN